MTMNDLNTNKREENQAIIYKEILEELQEIASNLHGEDAIIDVSDYLKQSDDLAGKENMGLYALKTLCEFYSNTRLLQTRIDEAVKSLTR